MINLFRKNIVSTLLVAVLLVILFVPNAKAWVLKTLLGTGVFNAGTTRQTEQQAAVEGITFTDATGQLLNTTNLKGKVIFINFWASWCPPCLAEMGSIQSLYDKLKKDNRVVFILADADNNPQLAADFMQKHGYNLPVYQSSSIIPEHLYTGTLPTTLIIDSKGQLVQKHEGIANYDTAEMRNFLLSL